MPEALLDGLDQLAIEVLGEVYDDAGADVFEDTAMRLVMSVCAMLVHERGPQRVRNLIELIAAGLPNNDESVLNWTDVIAAASGYSNGNASV
jgi:hypothetical protein